MNITQIPEGFALYKEKDEIGRCALTPTPKGGTFGAFCILPQWRRKGYGSYLLKEALRALGPAAVHRRHLRQRRGYGVPVRALGCLRRAGTGL